MHDSNETRKGNPESIIATVITAVLLLGTTAISNITTGTVLAYNQNQAASQANDCGNGSVQIDTVLCQNLASQIQGDHNSLSIAASQSLQPETPSPPTTGTLTVIKQVVCPAGVTCPPPSNFQMIVTVNNVVTRTFAGSSSPGTDVDIGPGSYSVDETVPTLPSGLTLTTTKSADCSGTINAGESKTCTITNTITVAATLIVKKIVQCAAGQQCPGLPAPSDFTMDIRGRPVPQFPGSAEGTPVTIEPGEYGTGEGGPGVTTPSPPGLAFVDFTITPGCASFISGPIEAGETRTCTWTNNFRPVTPG
jgi:hypothetical protein